jgi:AbrB family looped-hinge helix DNA binding protein
VTARRPVPANTLESRINAEGRVVVPAAIRKLLGVGPGDRLLFVCDEHGAVRLTSAKILIEAMWANNHGIPGGDSGEDIRQMRDADREMEAERERELAEQRAADNRTDDEIAEQLFTELGLPYEPESE